ncbi:MAG: hypothetical protein KC561_09545 [Myxococcales bacterium]|nr:hypothetical protein [Myxococcales bacterium]
MAELGAAFALTSKLSVDSQGYELWFNVLDPNGQLAWTRRAAGELSEVPKGWLSLLRGSLLAMQGRRIDISPRDLLQVGSWPAFIAFARGWDEARRQDMDQEGAERLLKSATTVVSLDNTLADDSAPFAWIRRVMDWAGSCADRDGLQLLQSAVRGSSEQPLARSIRQEIHHRLIALAKETPQT